MRKALFCGAICLALSGGPAFAGWYHVENFTGSIGPYPIHLSLQTYDHFGSGITVVGSYYYDTKGSPIPLYGRYNDGKPELCEIADDKALEKILIVGSKTVIDTTGCPFALDVDQSGATGTWRKGSRQYPVTLKRVGTLDDTGDAKLEGTVEIAFWAQTACDVVFGIYANRGSGICMANQQSEQEGRPGNNSQ